MVVVIVCVIVGFVGAGAAALIPRGGGSENVDVTSLWQSQSEEVRSEVCSAFRANPPGYLAFMEQTWRVDRPPEQDRCETPGDARATDPRLHYHPPPPTAMPTSVVACSVTCA